MKGAKSSPVQSGLHLGSKERYRVFLANMRMYIGKNILCRSNAQSILKMILV
jgi:hypothetical protein